MKIMTRLKIAIGLSIIFTSNFAFAHSGGLDARGGHYNRKTGVYHCHRSSCERQMHNQDRRQICNYGYGKKNCTVQERRYGY